MALLLSNSSDVTTFCVTIVQNTSLFVTAGHFIISGAKATKLWSPPHHHTPDLTKKDIIPLILVKYSLDRWYSWQQRIVYTETLILER